MASIQLPIRETHLRWRQPASFARRYELKGEAGLVAELEFPKKAGSLATGRILSAAWEFERKGQAFSRPVIRDLQGASLGEYVPNPFGTRGDLTLSNGNSYVLAATNKWNTDWQWLDAHGDGLLGFRFKSGLPNSAEVFLGDLELADLGLLVTFGFYLLILPHEDAAAPPGAVTAARD
ncbi:MAG: hypothetical protein K2Q23_08575 [Bryobacteraceae bacterium]|nr:hypothetical protein [Bryobacteraceae bacterium]